MKHIVQLGVHYEETPIKIRESIAFATNDMEKGLFTLHDESSIDEVVLIQTCNRTEIYLMTDNVFDAVQAVRLFLERAFELKDLNLTQFLKQRIDDEAITHLFRTVAGLDSLVVGETEILGQVKDAFLLSQGLACTGKYFNELFKRAIAFAKKMHTETALGEQARSVSYVAVNYVREHYDLFNQKVMVIGAGQTGERLLKNLSELKDLQIFLVNRSEKRGELLANNYQVHYQSMDKLPNLLSEVEFIFSATAASEKMITKEMVTSLEDDIGEKIFVDLAMPRDIDVEIDKIKGCHVINLESFREMIATNDQKRQEIARMVNTHIEPEVAAFQNWISEQEAVPIISALMEKSDFIQRTTMESIERKIPSLDLHDKKVIQKHTKSIIHQLLKDPIAQAKRMSQSQIDLETFEQIFGLRK